MSTLVTAMRHAQIETSIVAVDPPADADEWKFSAYNYRVTFTIKGLVESNDRSMVVPFATGKGWDREPSAAEVMRCVLSDAMGMHPEYGSHRFEDWAGDYGYDTDSRKAEKGFRALQEQAAEFEYFLTRAVAEQWYADTELLDSEASDAPVGRAIKKFNPQTGKPIKRR